MTDSFEFRYSFQSLIFHLLIIGILVLAHNLFNSETELKNYNTVLVQSSVRVDMVAMPRLTVQELKEIEKTTDITKPEVKKNSPKKQTPPSDDDFIKETPKAKKSFNDLIKNLSQKKTAVTKVNKKDVSETLDLDDKKFKQLVLRGNKLSQGTSITGEGSQQISGVFEKYLSAIPRAIKPYWKLPSYLLEKKLQCRLQIFVNQKGEIVKTQILQSSGNDEYDRKAISAVQSASPLSAPVPEIVPRLMSGSVVLGFPL